MSSDSSRLLRLSLALALGGFGIGSGEFVIMGLMQRVATDLQVPVPDVGYAISSYALGVVVGAPLISARRPGTPARIADRPDGGVCRGQHGQRPGHGFLDLRGPALSRRAAPWGLLWCRRPGGGLRRAVSHACPRRRPGDERADHCHRGRRALATWAGNLFGWEVAFIGVGVIALCTALLIRLWVPAQAPDPDASPRRELSALVKQRVLFTLGVASIGFGGMFSVFSYVMPTLTEQSGMAESWGPMVLMIFGIGTIIGNFAGARAADGNLLRAIPRILIWCALIQAGFYFAADWPLPAILFVGLVGTSMALGPALQTRLMDVAEDAQTMAASMNHAAFNLANALGAWLAGVTIKMGAQWSATGLVGAAPWPSADY